MNRSLARSLFYTEKRNHTTILNCCSLEHISIGDFFLFNCVSTLLFNTRSFTLSAVRRSHGFDYEADFKWYFEKGQIKSYSDF